jgi:hypothetical protein
VTSTEGEVLAELLEDLEDLPFHGHRPGGDCPLADPATDIGGTGGFCEVCVVLDMVTEAVVKAQNRLDKVKLGVVAA